MVPALRKVAEQVYSKHGGGDAAIQELIRQFEANKELRTLAMHFAASEALHYAQLLIRRRVEEAEPKEHPRTLSRAEIDVITKPIKSLATCWYDWPLMTGLKLGEATLDDLRDNQERYQRMAEGNGKKARFMALVANRLKPGQQVKQVCSEDELAALMKRAGKRGGKAA